MTRAALLALLPATMEQLKKKTGKSERYIHLLLRGYVWNVSGTYERITKTANMESGQTEMRL